MPQPNASEIEPPPVVEEVQAPVFTVEIPPETYKNRERPAARDALIKGRHNLLINLRDALRKANGKTVIVTITQK